MKTPEDEAFDDLERRLVKPVRHNDDDDVLCYRNELLEEVARAIEKFKGAFGPDTVASFATYVRGMKR